MSSNLHCSKCGAPVRDEVAGGFCSACLLEKGFSDRPADSALPLPLRSFGDYELVEEIARGGMGVVFKARQRSLNRLVAVKMILSGHLASEAEAQRFRAEARAAASLQHPNIVAIHEVGEHEGHLFFSMDFIAGRNLAQLAGDGPWPGTRAAQCVGEIAEAIHYAHEHGILHRDLKPSNVLIDAIGKPHVTDFGLAKYLPNSELETQNSELTLSGQVLGSPNFMPPEQAAGKHRELTPAADVYSLGALLYHLITGRPPFVADSVPATLRLVAETEPVSPRLLAPQLPRDLETICLRCLEKDPRRRYDTAQALEDELARFLRHEPIQARPLGQWEKFHRWTGRHPVIATLSGVIALLLIAVALISMVSAVRLRRANSAGQEKLREAYLSQARANRWSGRPGRRFESLDSIKNAAAIRPGLDLRNEAMAAMTLPDFRPLKSWSLGQEDSVVFDGRLEHMAHARNVEGVFEVSIRRVSDDLELAQVREPGKLLSLDLSEHARWLVLNTEVAGAPKQLIFDVEQRKVFPLPAISIWHCAPQEDRMAIAPRSNSGPQGFKVIELPSRAETLAIKLERKAAALCFSRDGSLLAVSLKDSSFVEIRKAATGELVQKLLASDEVEHLDWSSDRRMLAGSSFNGDIHLWDLASTNLQARRLHHGSKNVRARFNTGGNVLASTGWNDRLRWWNPISGLEVLNAPALGYRLDAFGAQDDRMTWWEMPQRVQLGEFACGKELGMIRFSDSQRHGDWHTHFSRDGRLAVFASQAGEGLRVRDMKGDHIVASLAEGTVWSVAISRSNDFILAVCDKKLKRFPVRMDATEVWVGRGEPYGPTEFRHLND